MPALLTIYTRCGTRNARCPSGHLLYAAGVFSATSTSLLPQEADRYPLTLLRETVTRRLALTFLASAVLRVPAAAHAEHDGTSHLPDGPGSGAYSNPGWHGGAFDRRRPGDPEEPEPLAGSTAERAAGPLLGDDSGGLPEQTPDYGVEGGGIYARRAAGILSHRSARSFPCQEAYAVVEFADTS